MWTRSRRKPKQGRSESHGEARSDGPIDELAPAPSATETAWATLHARWVAAIDGAGSIGRDRARIVEYTADVVETLLLRPAGHHGALTRFGERLGAEGWTLEHASLWIELLATLCGTDVAATLRSFDCGVAVAQGWAAGHLLGFRSDECFDAVTGLCTPAVLRLRLQQVFDQCASMNLSAGGVYRLVILDADLTSVGALEGDAIMVVLADLVQRTFCSGETIARDGSRIFILVSYSDRLEHEVNLLIERTRQRSLLLAARLLGWIEDLPPAPAMIDRYIADIAA